MKKRYLKYSKYILLVIIACMLISLLMYTKDEKSTYMPYKEFVRNIELGVVENVEIQESKVFVKNKNDETIFYTDNPETNDFKEYLLLNDVEIINSFGEDEIVNILDYLFYVVFFGSVGFGIFK